MPKNDNTSEPTSTKPYWKDALKKDKATASLPIVEAQFLRHKKTLTNKNSQLCGAIKIKTDD